MKKILLLVTVLVGITLAAAAQAGGNGSLRLAFPNTTNLYLIKGQPYDFTFYSKNWSKVLWFLNCAETVPLMSSFDIQGDTSVETLQRISLTLSTATPDASQCYFRVVGVGADTLVRGNNYDESSAPFNIVSAMPPLGKLQIENYSFIKNSYQPGETLTAMFKIRKYDGTFVTPADNDIGNQVLISYATPQYNGPSGPGVGGAATYDYYAGMWKWTLPTTLSVGSYNLEIIAWCSQGGGRCEWQYGANNQVQTKLPFRIFSDLWPSPSYSPTPLPTPAYNPNCLIWPRTEIVSQAKIYSLNEICDGDLIRAQGDIAVYIVKISNGKYFMRRFFGPQIFKAYGHLSFAKVKNVTPQTLSIFTDSPYLRLVDNDVVLMLSDIIPGISARLYYAQSGVDPDSIFVISYGEYNLYSSVGSR